MPDSKFFGVPFGTSGDKATIPEATQPGGAVSYQQGFGPDYERDPSTDPLAKRVPRDETNEFYFQVSNSLRFLQLYGLPEWYTQDDQGNDVSYPLTARVRHPQAGVMRAWVSVAANNTTEPGVDPSWVLDEPFSLSGLEATLAEAVTGTLGTKLITPRRMASSVQRGAWNYATAFGTANNILATLSPAPPVITAGMRVVIGIVSRNTGTVTLNLNGLGAAPVLSKDGRALIAGDLVPGFADIVFDGANYRLMESSSFNRGGISFTTPGTSNFTVPDGVYFIEATVLAGGGGGGGCSSAVNVAGGGGGSGGYTRGVFSVTPGQVIPITVGAGGNGGIGIATPPGSGGTSSFGALATATGGAPGGNSGNGAQIGGAGGNAGSGGDVSGRGQGGSPGFSQPAGSAGGIGGPSNLSGSGVGSQVTGTGAVAQSGPPGFLGSGGHGGCAYNAVANGGAGGAGAVILRW